MVTHDATPPVESTAENKQECFLCSLDPKHSCVLPQLEGRLLRIFERQSAEQRYTSVILDTGTQKIEVQLEHHYYHSLLKELRGKEELLGAHAIRLRVYHLPTLPVTMTNKGYTRLCYKGNTYTLAVLEPDVLLNITDLNQAEYCARQYTLNRLVPSYPSMAMLRGNLVHHCFKELLKEQNQVQRSKHGDSGQDATAAGTLPTLQRHLEQALDLYQLDMALANVSSESLRSDIQPHLESLARWFESERSTLWDLPGTTEETNEEHQDDSPAQDQQHNLVRAETFLLAPEIGLRGRLDLFWQQSGRQRLLELKTGGSKGSLPKTEHRWQVYGYHALLAVRRDSKMKRAMATLLYSGTPGSAQAFGIPATIREIQRVNERRNMLILGRVTGTVPEPPGANRCAKCAVRTSCRDISTLLNWTPPMLTPAQVEAENGTPPNAASRSILTMPESKAFFAKYYHLLQLEGHEGEQQQALLWQLPVTERIERGSTISGLELVGQPFIEKDGWLQTFRCTNTSELREGDEILLSNGNPVSGEVVSGTMLQVSSEYVTVWTRELIAHPTLIDRYDNDLVHVRTLQNLLRWLHTNAHLQDLVAGRVRPRFLGVEVPVRPDFNREQNLAVIRALQMQDYLLVHGPPGTGKTAVIAEIVKRLCAQGQRVLLAAFTNQAVDNMLKRLEKEGFHDYLRLGHERSVDDTIRSHLLKELVTAHHPADEQSMAAPERLQELVYDTLTTTPVVASTTATLSSDKYALPVSNGDESPTAGLYFDVVIVDEAGQLTIPAILGALRFARRFILVGDEQQLPPLVLSKEAAEQGLSDSLFSKLKHLDEEYSERNPLNIGACVALRTQYRMNKWISHFSSRVFYQGQLLPHESVADRRLRYPKRQKQPDQPALAKAIDPRYPLVFLDVPDEEVHEENKLSNAEARAIRSVVAELLLRGITPEEIGVIAPYRAQVANIRRHLLSSDPTSGWQGLSAHTTLNVDTVDRFQGGERNIIIMSFATTSTPQAQSQRRDFLTNPHRLNVALTRAQSKLILVGHAAALETLPIFQRLVTYCRSMNTLLPFGDTIHSTLLQSLAE